MFSKSQTISVDNQLSQTTDAFVNEWLKDTEVLVRANPRSVFFGYIECSISSVQLLSNGWLKIEYFRCLQSSDSSHYHLMIGAEDIYEWLYSDSQHFSAIIFRLQTNSIFKVKSVLGLNEDFNPKNSDLILVLNRALDSLKYKRFLDILRSEGVRLNRMDETEARLRYESAEQKKCFKRCSAHNVIDETGVQSHDSGLQLIERLLSEKIEPKSVFFGAYECKPQTIELIAFKSINFFGVQQNNVFAEQLLDLRVELTEVELILLCLDSNLPMVFMKLNERLAKVIQISLHLRDIFRSKYLFDNNSGQESERYIKVVFNECNKSCLLFFLMFGQRSVTSVVRQISKAESIQLIGSTNLLD